MEALGRHSLGAWGAGIREEDGDLWRQGVRLEYECADEAVFPASCQARTATPLNP